MWLVPEPDLTPDQLRAVRLRPDEHRIIFGAPGSGKTMILAHRAAFFMREGRIPPERLRIFVFTKVLKEYIRSALHYLTIPDICVSTFDAWCMDFHRQHIGKIPWDKGPDFAAIRTAVHQKLKSGPLAQKPFDVMLVDEGQDLAPEVFDILMAVSHHITVCMDHKQQIYDGGSDEAQILKSLGLKKRNISLLEAYRCSPYIVHIASSFIVSPEERENYIRQTKVPQSEKETPLFYIARDFEDEKRRLVEIVKARQAKGERIAILFGTQRQVAGFAMGLRELGLEVEIPSRRSNDEEGIDFNSDLPKLMPFHSAKGLTFDTVLMPRIVPRSFGQFSAERIERLLFVGVTRATKWLYFSSNDVESLPFLGRLQSLAKAGHLSIQKFDSEPGGRGLFDAGGGGREENRDAETRRRFVVIDVLAHPRPCLYAPCVIKNKAAMDHPSPSAPATLARSHRKRSRPAAPVFQAPGELSGGLEWDRVFHPMIRWSRYARLIASLRRRYAAERRFVCGKMGLWALGLVTLGFPATFWAIMNRTATSAPYIFAVSTFFLLIPAVIFARPFLGVLLARTNAPMQRRQMTLDLSMSGAGFRGMAAIEISRYALLSRREMFLLEWLMPAALASMCVSVRAWRVVAPQFAAPVPPPFWQAALWMAGSFGLLFAFFRLWARIAWIGQGHSRVAGMALFQSRQAGMRTPRSVWEPLAFDLAGIVALTALFALSALAKIGVAEAIFGGMLLLSPLVQKRLLKSQYQAMRSLLRDGAPAFDECARVAAEGL
jgi:hypothetical protein